VVKRVRQVPQAQRAKAARDATQESRLAAGVRAVLQWPRVLGGRGVAMVAGAVIVAVAVAVTGYLLSRTDTKRQVPDTRARHYKDVDACLLTGKDGITAGTTAAEVWQGMQDASLKTHARVSYVPVTGEQSAANARPYLNGLLQRSCDVVVATGRPELTAATQTAPQHQKVDFVLVGDAGADSTGAKNITVTRVGDGLRAEVAGVVEREVEARG
jgi:basic membrane lipoprotein Med (substrate-binding protein (PBP1-ABC) superfamily)